MKINHTWQGGDVCVGCGLKRRYEKGFLVYFIYGRWMTVDPLFACSQKQGEIEP